MKAIDSISQPVWIKYLRGIAEMGLYSKSVADQKRQVLKPRWICSHLQGGERKYSHAVPILDYHE